MCMCMYLCVCVRMCAYAYAYAYVYAYVFVNVHVHVWECDVICACHAINTSQYVNKLFSPAIIYYTTIFSFLFA